MERVALSRTREVAIPVAVAVVICILLFAGTVGSMVLGAIVGSLFAVPALLLGAFAIRLIDRRSSWSLAGQLALLCGVWVVSGVVAFGLAWAGLRGAPPVSPWWSVAPGAAIVTTMVRGFVTSRAIRR